MEMKMSCVCLVLGLVLLMTVSSDAQPLAVSQGHPDLCCFNFATSDIPDTEITGIVKTHHNCPKSGYVFTTPNGRFCKKDLQSSHSKQSS
ncbi:C-C motif chemokine 4 homolog [Pygocentrus nattereri]|uniref:C-C motif chemokine 4 homolog n=1 Tax=Pygocentrus nattereri TaxID=42514 RepID=UPI0008147EE6|nr:C-C motif chemokine 4 homolog [Pygocentrus nattereri]